MVEEMVYLGEVEAGDAVEMERHRRVDVTGPASHHQTLQRCQAHGSVHRSGTNHRGGRRTVAEVEDHLTKRAVTGAAGERGGRLGDELVGGSVVAEAPDAVGAGGVAIERVGGGTSR